MPTPALLLALFQDERISHQCLYQHLCIRCTTSLKTLVKLERTG